MGDTEKSWDWRRRLKAIDAASPSAQTHYNRQHSLPKNQEADVTRRASKRHPNSDLLGSPRYRMRDHGVEPNGGEEQRDHCKSEKQAGIYGSGPIAIRHMKRSLKGSGPSIAPVGVPAPMSRPESIACNLTADGYRETTMEGHE